MDGYQFCRRAQAVQVAVADGAGSPADSLASAPTNVLVISDQLSIPRAELDVKASRSSGAGGQHVNKTASRVEIAWNVATSSSLTDEQRQLLSQRLASRLSAEGSIRVVASDTRSQLRNREHAESRLIEMVRRGLTVPKRRKATRRPRGANEARLTVKKKHSDKKRERQRPAPE
ncbi:MAG: aminoacyl-tRNA hydrolase [Gemmatimonadaceae bacterium]|nr:aminoacyl-tRNA hydrolase [Gemmatimonadaceae bacterium]